MYSATVTRAEPRVGFPIRKSPDLCLLSGFPELIAASHVLHRLLAPRHPPRALLSLTTFLSRGLRFLCGLSIHQGYGGLNPPTVSLGYLHMFSASIHFSQSNEDRLTTAPYLIKETTPETSRYRQVPDATSRWRGSKVIPLERR